MSFGNTLRIRTGASKDNQVVRGMELSASPLDLQASEKAQGRGQWPMIKSIMCNEVSIKILPEKALRACRLLNT